MQINRVMWKKVLLGVFAVPLLVSVFSGCGDSNLIQSAKQKVESQLNDPMSVQYQNVAEFSEEAVCGQLNAKNQMGGYEGFKPFVVVPNLVNHVRAEPRTVSIWCNNNPGKRAKWYAFECLAKTHHAKISTIARPDSPSTESAIKSAKETCDLAETEKAKNPSAQ